MAEASKEDPPLTTEIATELEKRLVDSINAERSAEGLAQLKIEVHLNASAEAHSEWMAETGSFSHVGENGSSTTDRIEETGFPLTGSWQTAENLAYTSISGELDAGEADKMHEGLMGSDGHRANILDPNAAYVGIGLSVGNITIDGDTQEVVFLTENFADTDGQVLVQEEVDGETVLQPYLDGEPDGEPQVVEPSPDEDPDDPDETPSPTEDPDDPEEPPAIEDPDDPNRDDERDEETGSGGGCFVATAAYGGRSHPDVMDLRRFRDEILIKHRAGRVFIRAYWLIGPKLAGLVSHDDMSGRAARSLISPLARLARKWVDRRR